MIKPDWIEQKAIDLINGVDCAGGCMSAADIADAIRGAVMDERAACSALAHKIGFDPDASVAGTPSQVWRSAGERIGREISKRNI